jgi:hypothetical protein
MGHPARGNSLRPSFEFGSADVLRFAQDDRGIFGDEFRR